MAAYLTRILVLAATLGLIAAPALGAGKPRSSGASNAPAAAPNAADEKRLADWQQALGKIRPPAKGCFTAEYPKLAWTPVACVKPADIPFQPAPGPLPAVVGNGTDWSARVASGFIQYATGYFGQVTGVTSLSSNGVSNRYSLQLNTDRFVSPACGGSPNPECRAIEQFIFLNNHDTVAEGLIQYWLTKYDAACPGGWTMFTNPGSSHSNCYRNAAAAVDIPLQSLSNLRGLSVTADVRGGADDLRVATGTMLYAVMGDNYLDVAAGWTAAEFNVFGDCCSHQAVFNEGTNIVVRTVVYGATLEAPSCLLSGTTAETSNLTLSDWPVVSPVRPEPRIDFLEANPGVDMRRCAETSGDTHLSTFSGLFYDFQASGDFVLAKADPDFMVTVRQASGAPTWPDASLNKAVATRIGSTAVAICTAPTRVFVNGAAASVDDGTTLSLPGDVSIYRGGNSYLISRKNAERVRVAINSGPSNTWMDVQVGLPRAKPVSGLIVNPGGNLAQLAMRDGTVLPAPISFDDLYRRYGESWRAKPNENLLAPCGKAVEAGIPSRPFYAADLPDAVRKAARKTCIAAAVDDPAALEACTLDVAVLGPRAAKAFENPPASRAVLIPGQPLKKHKPVRTDVRG